MNRQIPAIQVEKTADGSRTLYLPSIDDHYHSIKGALTESQHIFINLGFDSLSDSNLHILEVGFGTGLNAFLTLQASAATGCKIHYTGIELYPLPVAMIRELQYSDDPGFMKLHLVPWNEDALISPNFTLYKIEGDFTRHIFREKYDLIYFDAFAPDKQPEMWSQELFNYLYVIINNGGVLATYCAKGVVRRMLQTAGFTVERLPGPPGGKREVLRATKNNSK